MAPGVPAIGWLDDIPRKGNGKEAKVKGEGLPVGSRYLNRPIRELCTTGHFWSLGLESASLRGAEELSFSWTGHRSKYNQASYEGNSVKQRLRTQLPSNKRLIDLHSKVKCGVHLAYYSRGWHFHIHTRVYINTWKFSVDIVQKQLTSKKKKWKEKKGIFFFFSQIIGEMSWAFSQGHRAPPSGLELYPGTVLLKTCTAVTDHVLCRAGSPWSFILPTAKVRWKNAGCWFS